MTAIAPSLIMGMASVGSAASSASATRAQGAYQAQVASVNAGMAETQANQALSRGDQQVHAIERQKLLAQGQTRARAAASGVDPDSGDAASVQTESNLAAAEDVRTTKNNAWLSAFGFKTQANNATAQGKFARLAAENNARNTVLTGGMRALGYGIEGYRMGFGKGVGENKVPDDGGLI